MKTATTQSLSARRALWLFSGDSRCDPPAKYGRRGSRCILWHL